MMPVVNKKYKTTLCRHFSTNGNCQLGARCVFAHGQEELRVITDPLPSGGTTPFTNGGMPMMGGIGGAFMQKTPGANFKTIKCKYFENGGYCKNQDRCTFAHGDTDLKGGAYSGAALQDQTGISTYSVLVKCLENAFAGNPAVVQQLKEASQYIFIGDVTSAITIIQQIMTDPSRTQQDIEYYTMICQQIQAQSQGTLGMYDVSQYQMQQTQMTQGLPQQMNGQYPGYQY